MFCGRAGLRHLALAVRNDNDLAFDESRRNSKPMLSRVIVINIPVLIAFGASAVAFVKERTPIALVQLVGAVCLLVVIFTHIAEAFDLFPSMGWGQPNSPGHCIDIVSAFTSVILLTVGYFSRNWKKYM